jgi:hypothetical protein
MIYIRFGYASGPINRLVTCQKERKRDRDRARNAAMSPEQRALLNKRRRELYAMKRSAKMLQMTSKETAQSTGMVIILIYLHQKISLFRRILIISINFRRSHPFKHWNSW